MSGTGKGELSGVPDQPSTLARFCLECAEPIATERVQSPFCSSRCRDRQRQRRHRSILKFEFEVDEVAFALHAEYGSVFGVECDRQVADVLREEAQPPKRRRRRIPIPRV